MRATSRAHRVGLWSVLATGVLTAVAGGQSAWQVRTIAASTGLNIPPAMIFDGQDRAQILYDGGGANLWYVGASGSGAGPTWSGPMDTGLATGDPTWGGIYGQTYLAMTGGVLYAVCRPYATSSGGPRIRARVFNGTAWATYVPSFNYVNVYGLIVDKTGTLQWVVNTEPTAQPPAFAKTGYYLASQDSMGVVTAVPLALGVSGALYVSSSEPVLSVGGQVVLDKSDNLHMVQFYGDTRALQYAKGPMAGPLSVTDNIDMTWRVKLGQPSIAVDAAGTAHIVYTQDWPGYGVKHLWWTGSSWAGEWVETGGSAFGLLGTFPQVLVGKTGVLHVVYSDLLNNVIKHAVKTQGSWQVETIGTISAKASSGAMRGALAAGMDSLGGIGVVYRDSVGTLTYAYEATPVSAATGAVRR